MVCTLSEAKVASSLEALGKELREKDAHTLLWDGVRAPERGRVNPHFNKDTANWCASKSSISTGRAGNRDKEETREGDQLRGGGKELAGQGSHTGSSPIRTE